MRLLPRRYPKGTPASEIPWSEALKRGLATGLYLAVSYPLLIGSVIIVGRWVSGPKFMGGVGGTSLLPYVEWAVKQSPIWLVAGFATTFFGQGAGVLGERLVKRGINRPLDVVKLIYAGFVSVFKRNRDRNE